MHNFVYLSLYIISIIKIINKTFLFFYFIFITPYLLMKEMILTQAIKSFIILAHYCYLHMHKLQLKKKTINKNVGVQERFYGKTIGEYI